MQAMKGIILAGGKGTRLAPLTNITSKHLLPVYNKQMIFYPLETLRKGGVTEILMIVTPEHRSMYEALLGDGSAYGVKLSYATQPQPNGLPEAFIIGESFIGTDNVALILGDNFFEDDFSEVISSFTKGAHVFAKEVTDPERFGVVTFGDNMSVTSIEEKPKNPKSNFAITGLYLYDSRVVEFAKKAKPSARNELEIVDMHNAYLATGELSVHIFTGLWEDAGTFDSLLRVSNFAKQLHDKGNA